MREFTRIAEAIGGQDAATADKLLPLVYAQLRRLAAVKLAGEASGQTLQATALVHEAWLRVSANQERQWNDQAHFFAVAAEAMRRILIDRARRRRAIRHGGGQHRVEIEDIPLAAPMPDERLLALHEALRRLEKDDPTKAELVKLRYFAGLTLEEAGKVLNLSEATAKRYWAFARAWLQREIKRMEGES
jgi:RNA polymerase sigma factor (TIGR02999 family)